jgi:hypothetical protein
MFSHLANTLIVKPSESISAYLKSKLLSVISILLVSLIFVGCGTYTVVFYDDDDNRIIALSTTINNASIKVPAAPDKAGYIFTGWEWHGINATEIIAPGTLYYTPTKDIAFKARYAIDLPPPYTVIFLGDNNNKIATLSATPSSPITAPAAPVKTHYTFKGWQEIGKNTTIAQGTSYAPIKHTVFRAKYELNAGLYKISFYDAELESLGYDVITIGSGINLNAKASSFGVVNWYRAQEATPTSGTFISNGDINFYAVPNIVEIRDQAGLDSIRNNTSAKYILTNDIVLDSNGVGFGKDGSGWTPPHHTFTGIFNGNGYAISGLWIWIRDISADNAGLFKHATNATIKNLGILTDEIRGYYYVGGIAGSVDMGSVVTNSYVVGNIRGGNYIGGIAGQVSSSTIADSYFVGSVDGANKNVGGIAGYVVYGSTITNTHSTARVMGTEVVGGIAGYVANSSIITDSYSTGSVNGTHYRAGGIAGLIFDSNISDSYSTGSISADGYVGGIAGDVALSSIITNAYSTGSISGNDIIGGIAGHIASDSIITNAYSAGSVSGGYNVGGIAGDVHNATITNSYHTGSVNANQYVGGIAGDIYDRSTITNSYSMGNIKGNGYVGGIAGHITPYINFASGLLEYNSIITNNAAINQAILGLSRVNRILGSVDIDAGTVKNNFAKESISGSFSDPNKVLNAGEAKTESELKSQSTYASALGWKFGNNDDNPWKISAGRNGGYPYLYWEE